MSMTDVLTKSSAAQQAAQHRPTPATPSFKEPKVKDPNTFDGSPKSLNGFLTECELVFELQSSRFGNDYTNDCAKINYMVSLLCGIHLDTIRPYITSTLKPSFLFHFDEFVLRLKLNCGDPNETGRAGRKLKALRHTTSPSAFAEFQQYIAVLQRIDVDMIVGCAIDGLKPNLKDKNARTGTNFISLRNLMRFTTPPNKHLFEREQERKHGTKDYIKPSIIAGNVTTVASPSQTTKAPIGVLTNLAQPQPTMPKLGNKLCGPLTPKEKQYRRDNGLCLYCASKEHFANDCPLIKMSRLQAVPWVNPSQKTTKPRRCQREPLRLDQLPLCLITPYQHS